MSGDSVVKMVMARMLAALAVLTALCGTAASAQQADSVAVPATSAAADYANAIRALLQRLGTVQSDQPAVGMADVEVRGHLETIERTVAQFGTPEFPVNGMVSLEGVCRPLFEISVRYTQDGRRRAQLRDQSAGEPPPPQMVDPTVQMTPVMTNNEMRFQDELAILRPSGIRCLHAHLPFITAVMNNLPPAHWTPRQLSTFSEKRTRLLEGITSILAFARLPDMRPENRRKYFNAVAQTIDGYVAIMPLSTRGTIRYHIRTSPPVTDADGIAIEQTVLAALQSTQCTGLCLIE